MVQQNRNGERSERDRATDQDTKSRDIQTERMMLLLSLKPKMQQRQRQTVKDKTERLPE